MRFYSTNDKDHKVSLKKAVVKGLAPDKGLYMPERIEKLPPRFFKAMSSLTFPEIALEVAFKLFGEDVPVGDLQDMVDDAFDFPIPLVEIEDNIYTLELFHGPTLAFKDIGARFMARLLAHLISGQKQMTRVLVATSGDTGSAVANGFLGVDGIEVIILYPKGKVSPLQEKQLTTLGENITALEVDGVFDDCQHLVKQAFLDEELNKRLQLTSANSINVARFLPQSFYYFYALAQLPEEAKNIVVSVPSGNFGNLTGGLIAKKMGLPLMRFIAATNDNKIVPHYLKTGRYEPKPSIKTVANAMDVGHPSNFVRMLDLFGGEHQQMSSMINGFSMSDAEIMDTISLVYDRTDYLLDPHGAIGYKSLEVGLKPNETGIFLETAHPAKFNEVVEEAINEEIELPEALAEAMEKEKRTISMGIGFDEFKQYLMNLPQ